MFINTAKNVIGENTPVNRPVNPEKHSNLVLHWDSLCDLKKTQKGHV